MLVLRDLTIRNFFSVGNITQAIDLQAHPLTLVLGENLDALDLNSRNGTGKSTILQAICYVLYGTPITAVTLDRLVNNQNEKNMLVTLEFTTRGHAYRIERGRKPNLLRFYIDGVDHAQGENRHTQTEVDRVIGMSYLMFVHTVALSTFVDPYLELRTAEQREVIEELLMITKLTQQALSLKAQMDNTKELTRDEQARIEANTQANQRIETAVNEADASACDWQRRHDGEVQTLLRAAEAMSEIDIDAELAAFDRLDRWQDRQAQHQRTVQALNEQIGHIKTTLQRTRADVTRQQNDTAHAVKEALIQRVRDQIKSLETDAAKDITRQLENMALEASRKRQDGVRAVARSETARNELAALQRQIAAPDSHHCSTCGQGLVGTDHLQEVIHRLQVQARETQAGLERALADAERHDGQAALLEQEAATMRHEHGERATALRAEALRLREETVRQEAELQADRQALTARITEAATAAQQEAQQLRDLEDRLQAAHAAGKADVRPQSNYPDRSAVHQLRRDRDRLFDQIEHETNRENPHVQTADRLRQTLMEIDYERLNALITTAKHEQFLYKLLTNKDSFLRKRIIDQNLALLNKRLNFYLEQLGLPHEVVFQSDTSVAIHFMGKQMDYAQMSRGEMNRIWLGIFWSFRDVWESTNTPINLVFADEVLDQGIDPAGVQAAVDMLTRMAADRGKNVFLISHKEDLRERLDTTLLARRENRFTSFVTA